MAARSPSSPSLFAEWRAFWLGDELRRMQLWRWMALGFLFLFGAQWFRIDKELAGAHRKVAPNAEVAYVAPVAAMRAASLGNQSFLADLLFLRAAHYFVDHLITDSRLPWLELYLDAVWGLDARIKDTYRWGAQVVKFGQRIDAEVAERANRYARLGLAYFPEDPWLYHEIAFNLRYSLAPLDPKQEQRLRDLALQYLEIAYSFPGFALDPNYLVGQYMRAGRGDDSVQAAMETYAQASEEQRATLRMLLEEKNKTALAAELSWLDEAQHRDWPWAQPALAILLGPKRVAAAPGSAAPDAYYAEPPTPPELRKRLGVTDVRPVDGGGLNSDEQAGRGLPAGITAASKDNR